MQKLLSVFSGVNDTKGKIVRIDDAISRIRSGAKGLAEKTRNLNKWYFEKPERFRGEKLQLPAVTWAGTFTRRKAEHLHTHSGLIVLDVDNDIDLGTVLADFAQHPNVLLAFVSPSGKGVKPVIPVCPIPQNATEHEHAFNAVLEVFSEYAERDPKELPKQRDVSRLCFLAHDPRAIHNPNALPVEWEVDETLFQEQAKESQQKQDYSHLPVDIKALDFIPKDLPYEEWRNIGMAIKEAGLPISVWADWCNGQRFSSSQGWITEDLERYWSSFNRTGGKITTWGSVIHLAKEKGYIPPITSRRKPVKLQNVPKYEKVIETLHTVRYFLKGIFEKGSNFFAIRTDTGTGKTENAITYALRKDVAIPTQSGKLRDEIVSRATDKEMFAWGYRGIRETEEADGYMPCIQSERFETLRNKGFNPYKWICEDCPAYLDCKARVTFRNPTVPNNRSWWRYPSQRLSLTRACVHGQTSINPAEEML